PWHKAEDPYGMPVGDACVVKIHIYRPDHGPLDLVGLGDDGSVWHVDPHHDFGVGLLGHSHAIVTVLSVPVGVFDDVAVGKRTAGDVAAFQLVKPRLEWRVRVTPVEIAPQRQQGHQPKPHSRDLRNPAQEQHDASPPDGPHQGSWLTLTKKTKDVLVIS